MPPGEYAARFTERVIHNGIANADEEESALMARGSVMSMSQSRVAAAAAGSAGGSRAAPGAVHGVELQQSAAGGAAHPSPASEAGGPHQVRLQQARRPVAKSTPAGANAV